MVSNFNQTEPVSIKIKSILKNCIPSFDIDFQRPTQTFLIGFPVELFLSNSATEYGLHAGIQIDK